MDIIPLRNRILAVRLRPAEMAIVTTAATKVGEKRSEWVRRELIKLARHAARRPQA